MRDDPHGQPENHPFSEGKFASVLEHLRRPLGAKLRNPSFDVSAERVAHEWSRLRMHPAPLARPVVVISGWRAPQVAAMLTSRRLASITSRRLTDFLPVGLMGVHNIEEAASRVVHAVDRKAPSPDGAWTTEVDVVAISMGGLASRLAAADRSRFADTALPAKRLKLARLFPLATPPRGASLAPIVAPDAPSRCMKPGCPFLRRLDEALEADPLEIVPYARLRDGMVGAQHAAPPERNPLWIDGPPALSHLAITTDKRIMLDIALRLRGEPPIAREGEAPPRE